MNRQRLASAIVVAMLTLPRSAGAIPYSFTQIADSTGSFTAFGGASINENGTVAFLAFLQGGGHGIFTGSGSGPFTPIATTGGAFSSLGDFSLNAGGTVAFSPGLAQGGLGIFAGSGGPLTTIAETNGTFSGLSSPSINASGTVAFLGVLKSQPGVGGVFAGSGGPIMTIADASGPLHTAGGPPSINAAGTVAFTGGLDTGASGIFTSNGGPLTTITDSINGPLSSFFSFTAINNNGTVAFSGFVGLTGISGIFTSNGGPLTTIADTAGPFSSFDIGLLSLNESGTVAFSAFLDGSGIEGIFTGPDPVADKVIAVGDPLFGSTVLDLSLYLGALNDAGQLAFSAFLENGTSVVVLAEPAVTIDIQPGSFPNLIDLAKKRQISVAILTTATFDAATVDPTTVRFGATGIEAAPVDSVLQVVDRAGHTRLLLGFLTQDTGIACGDTSASLTGKTFSGQAFRGSDAIQTVGCP